MRLIKVTQNVDNRKKVQQLPSYKLENSNTFANFQYIAMNDLAYDVRKTDSLVSPYIGTISFTLNPQSTDIFNTKDEAAKDTNFIDKDSYVPHRLTYAFQNNNWILKKEEIFSDILGEWRLCKEDGSINAGCY
ncbi:hypothetical protein [Brevibacillus laterosporus]|uniref:hypothetical protein n=1 Tax=Brevibacillus laterosporus TaxID=1465 RepID=UPI000E6BBE93|nr:hypothetical protein [Brevibacillus laterosporus]AYB38217.1 hypothetical protein D5F52_07995 [Brevibacillus laterosporus]MBG9774474.1 hypothetical protein [Brevibacillus laterosporus]MBM7111850.1 hypothetical protein [Brevibacillus laterosporus]NKQ22533.1 hypothetical protein [Brevibacillus laterosporus]WNX29224.1 hypothetical protein RWW94_13285 [Brevibacillus laterosporus]